MGKHQQAAQAFVPYWESTLGKILISKHPSNYFKVVQYMTMSVLQLDLYSIVISICGSMEFLYTQWDNCVFCFPFITYLSPMCQHLTKKLYQINYSPTKHQTTLWHNIKCELQNWRISTTPWIVAIQLATNNINVFLFVENITVDLK